MEPITLFDALNDKTYWSTEWCRWCEKALPTRKQTEEELIIIQAYVGQHGHLCFIGYHEQCYQHYVDNEKIFTELVDKSK